MHNFSKTKARRIDLCAFIYNSFPWLSPTAVQKAKIEKSAQGIMDARAVMEVYGFPVKTTTEAGCVAELMRMYQDLTKKLRLSNSGKCKKQGPTMFMSNFEK